MTSDPRDERDLERVIDRALQTLQPPQAPGTLLPRVMGAVRALEASSTARKPWLARGWQWQLASVALGMLAIVAVAGGWMWASSAVATVLPGAVVETGGGVGRTVASMGDLAHAFELVWRAVVAPVAKGLFAVTAALALLCAFCVTAVNRLALGGASRS
jgi:hypothetical protein